MPVNLKYYISPSISDLSEGHQILAIMNMESQGLKLDLSLALDRAFSWNESYQGYEFWEGIFDKFFNELNKRTWVQMIGDPGIDLNDPSWQIDFEYEDKT